MVTQQWYVAVVGPGDAATPNDLADAREVGSRLANAGAVLLTGGHDGVMRAAASGCAEAGGTSIAILPEGHRRRVHPEATYSIPTGMGELRNGLLVRAADVVICVALSWGTLSEVALAVRTEVPVIVLGGWDLPLTGPVVVGSPAGAVEVARELAAAEAG